MLTHITIVPLTSALRTKRVYKAIKCLSEDRGQPGLTILSCNFFWIRFNIVWREEKNKYIYYHSHIKHVTLICFCLISKLKEICQIGADVASHKLCDLLYYY